MAENNQPEFAAINRAFEEEVIGQKNYEALKKIYTANAQVLPPGDEMVEGLPKIIEFWTNAVSTLGINSAKLTTLNIEVNGETAYEVGSVTMQTSQPTSPTTMKYVVIWKQENGSWKWHVDIWNQAN